LNCPSPHSQSGWLRHFADQDGDSNPVSNPYSEWLPLIAGDGIRPEDERALIVRRDLGGGRIWGTTSISLVAATAAGLRYDFTAAPGDPAAWSPVPLDTR